jgi:hypothetical protein
VAAAEGVRVQEALRGAGRRAAAACLWWGIWWGAAVVMAAWYVLGGCGSWAQEMGSTEAGLGLWVVCVGCSKQLLAAMQSCHAASLPCNKL